MKPKIITVTKAQLKEANLPPRFWDTGTDDVRIAPGDVAELWDYVEHFRANARKSIGVVIYGTVQTGKTSLMAIILKSLMARNLSAKYVRLDDLVSLHFERQQEGYDYTHDDLLKADVLGVDDIATNDNAGYPIALGNLLRARFNAQRPTILTVTLRDEETVRNKIEAEYGIELAQLVSNHFIELPMVYSEILASKPVVKRRGGN